MFPKPVAALTPNTFAFEELPLVKPTGFRAIDTHAGLGFYDLTADEAVPVVEGVTRRLTDSVRSDLFEAYVRALQATHGVRLNSAAIAAANARIQ